ncbi:MAG TPA: hypothetical protein PLX85_01820 [Dehalococcoidia bacterium]|nr:hypothetical protein [Dehalococcoidia bacterium]
MAVSTELQHGGQLMRNVHLNPLVRSHGSLRVVGSRGPAIRQFASRQTHDRPLLVAGSLLVLGLLPVAAYASRRAFGRPQPDAAELLPRNQEWYPWE